MVTFALEKDAETTPALNEVLAEAAYNAYCKCHEKELDEGETYDTFDTLTERARLEWQYVAMPAVAGFVAARKLYEV